MKSSLLHIIIAILLFYISYKVVSNIIKICLRIISIGIVILGFYWVVIK